MEVFFPLNTFFHTGELNYPFFLEFAQTFSFLALPLAAESAARFDMINEFSMIQTN